jgi:hypothetical protein
VFVGWTQQFLTRVRPQIARDVLAKLFLGRVEEIDPGVSRYASESKAGFG